MAWLQNIYTMHGQISVPVQRVDSLVIQKLDKSENPILIPKTYSREAIPSRFQPLKLPENGPTLKT